MAQLEINNIRIAGISSCVPTQIVENKDSKLFDTDESLHEYIQSVGVVSRRVTPESVTSSTLCEHAALRLLDKLGWERDTIDCLLFVSQTGDYIYPATACVLQGKLQLPTSCMALDITMGCSGWVYGMSVAASLLQSGNMKRILLLTGETVSKTRSPYDKVNLITGDAGNATALEYDSNAKPMYFELNTDGTEAETIMIRDGGFKHPVTLDSFEYHIDEDGVKRNNLQTKMDGAGVFAFAISQAPRSIKRLLEVHQLQMKDIDYWLFHQANKMIDSKIAKKLGGVDWVNNLTHFGNTSSTSIPLAITCQCRGDFANKRCIACAFGVGLSWGTVYFETDENIVVPELVEL